MTALSSLHLSQHLFEARRLNVLEQRRAGGQPAGNRERNIKSPVTNRWSVDRAVSVVWTHRLGRVIQRNQRTYEIPSLGPVFEEAWKIVHASVKSGLA